MRSFWRHPERNAFVLGLVQGIPQGLTVPNQIHLFAPAGRELDFTLVVCFGLFGPPLFMVLSHLINGGKNSAWWTKASAYVNLSNMVFWGCLSLGLLGWYSLRASNSAVGYSFCAFFIAGGLGFLVAGVVDKWLLKKAADAT